jgi:hypothetical protein
MWSIEELRQHIEFDSDDRDALIARYAQALDYCLTYCDEPRWKQPDDLLRRLSAPCFYFSVMPLNIAERRQTQLYANQRAHDLLFQVRNWRGETDEAEGA